MRFITKFFFLYTAPRKKKSKKKGVSDEANESPSSVGGRCLSPFQKRRAMKQQQTDSSSSTDEDESDSGTFVTFKYFILPSNEISVLLVVMYFIFSTERCSGFYILKI